jgi:23S rRNA (cytidine1920-2'-O)/16S rRNA (cytidine1409-2'-O)-methyltransferase
LAGKTDFGRLPQATRKKDDCTKLAFCNIDVEALYFIWDLVVKMRLDLLLVQRELVSTRSKAQDLIKRGAVRVRGAPALKAGQEVAADEALEVLETGRYVARSALKLKAALDAFGLDPSGLTCLDAGASTGGFTEVLLERGAARVFAADVGRDQLHPTLRANPKVVSLESTDARSLTAAMFPSPIEAIVCDVSFISLLKVLPAILPLAQGRAWLAALIKPQFEGGRAAVGKGGIVKDEAAKDKAIQAVLTYIEQAGWTVRGTVRSPILGQDGNEETLVGATRNA